MLILTFELDIQCGLDPSIKVIPAGYYQHGHKMKSMLDPEIHDIKFMTSKLETLEWWISRLMLNPLFFANLETNIMLVSRLNI